MDSMSFFEDASIEERQLALKIFVTGNILSFQFGLPYGRCKGIYLADLKQQ